MYYSHQYFDPDLLLTLFHKISAEREKAIH